MDTGRINENERGLLMDHFNSDDIQLDLSLQPFFNQKGNMQRILMMMIDDAAMAEGLALSTFLFKIGMEQQVCVKADNMDMKLRGYLMAPIMLLNDEDAQLEQQIIANQWMGTNLFIAGHWEFVKRLKRLALKAGYVEDEIHCSGYGIKQELVFCVKCCSLTIKTDEYPLTCPHCGTLLDISDRYSKRLDAWLGFIHGGIRRGGA
ncbi:hypothetical protein QS257_11320 [Terrilactibacillus sp. S3-3]|nr:hypothetical protein QS257_11320 [Terrilactibacillus sp. S3-3]